jgi:drug/metabolite transporter (DMT)-like permease
LNSAQLRTGLACTLAAGLLWGMVFIAPVLLPGYSAAHLSISRYLAFGLIALVLATFNWPAIKRLDRADWLMALELALVGNLLYYGFLAAAIQAAGAPLPTMIIGALPVVISICGNFGKAALPWNRLVLPLILIGAGIGLVNHAEWQHGQASIGQATQQRHLLLGALLAVGAVVCWTWYPLRNSYWLQKRPNIGSATWANVQGLATLPLALLGLIGLLVVQRGNSASLQLQLFGEQPGLFIGLMLALGLGASWLGTLLWNRASQVLPASLTGQLIVFETLAALLYAFIHRGQPPSPGTWLGIAALVAGVVMGVRAFRST